jgi:hypothetical protein
MKTRLHSLAQCSVPGFTNRMATRANISVRSRLAHDSLTFLGVREPGVVHALPATFSECFASPRQDNSPRRMRWRAITPAAFKTIWTNSEPILKDVCFDGTPAYLSNFLRERPDLTAKIGAADIKEFTGLDLGRIRDPNPIRSKVKTSEDFNRSVTPDVAGKELASVDVAAQPAAPKPRQGP